MDLRETAARAIADAMPDPGCDLDTDTWYWPILGAGTYPLADAVLAAIEPMIRADERRKTYADMISTVVERLEAMQGEATND